MELYLLKFSACLLVFWLIYVLLLEKQQMHHFKRFYLIGSFVVALIIPQLTIIEYIEPIVQNFEVPNTYIPIDAEFLPQPIEETTVLTLETVLWSIYTLGVLLFSIRFTVNLIRLYKRITTNTKQRNQNFIYVLLKEYRIPHSFFSYIFVNQQQFKNSEIPKEVRLHEETHAKQWHSLDILLLELLQIVFWFHPLVYILKHHVKLNHEFLADDAVLNEGINTKTYQNILLQFSSSTQDYQLASAINYSSFKKRFTVMKTQTSKTRIWLSTILVLPIIAVLFYSFAEREYVEKDKNADTNSNSFLVFVEKKENTLELRCESGCKWSHLVLKPNSEPYIINDFGFSEGKTIDTDKFAFSIKPNQSGVTLNGLKGTAWVNLAFSLPKNKNQAINQLGMTNETVPNLEQISDDLQKRAEENYYKNQTFVVKDEQGRNVRKKFFELDYDNKIKWVYTNEIPYHRIDVTELHFEEAKNSKKNIIKVNGNYTSDEELNNYKASDFITFSYTPISELAEMKEQSVLNLVTPSAYNLFVRLMISSYKQTLDDYESEITLSESKRKTDIKELVRTYEFLYYNFKKFTPEIIKQNQLIPPTPISAKEYDWQKVEDILDPQRPTAEEVAEYNTWAKKIHTESKVLSKDSTWFPPIDEEDLIKFSDIYRRMSSQQKKQSIEFPFPGLDVKTDEQQNPIKTLKTNKNKNIILLEHWYITIDNSKYYYPYKKGDLKKYYDKYGNEVDLDIVREYLKKHKTFEALKNTSKHYVYKSKEEQKEMDALFSDLGGMYFRMSKTNKAKVKRPISPVKPYIQITLNGKTYYKKYKELTAEEKATLPPPPPPPKESKDSKGGPNSQQSLEPKTVIGYPASAQQKATAKQVAQYNKIAKKYNGQSKDKMIVRREDVKRLKYIYGLMSAEQKKNAEPFPDFPPAPIVVEVEEVPPPPPIPQDASPEEKKRMKKVIEEYRKKHPESVTKNKVNGEVIEVVEIPVDQKGTTEIFGKKYKYVTKDGETTYYDAKGKKYTEEEFKGYIKTIEKEQKSILPKVNGKVISSAKLKMTRADFKAIDLSTKNGNVSTFKLKIPGKPTQYVKGNTIDLKSVKHINEIKKDDHVVIFDIKDKSDIKIEPLVIIITD